MNHLQQRENIPVFIITGFFGSGKTTIIANIIKQSTMKIGIIENDLAEVNIDGSILTLKEGQIEVISNACICCTGNKHIAHSIDHLIRQHPDIEAIIIETTGLANPRTVAEQLHSINVKYGVTLQGIICTVDAKNYFEHSNFKEQNAQIVYSDSLIVTKSDLVDQELLNRIDTELLKLNPTADARCIDNGTITYSECVQLLETSKRSFGNTNIDGQAVVGENLHDDIKTFSYTFRELGIVNPFKISDLLRNYVTNGKFIRSKGIFKFPKSTDMYVFQGVEQDVVLTQQPSSGDFKSSVVFIGKDINTTEVLNTLEDCYML